MSAILAFFGARKWLVDILLLGFMVVLIGLGVKYFINVGIQHQKNVDQVAYSQLKAQADEETSRLKGVADAAEHAHDQELSTLRLYRDTHALHGGLCLNATANQQRRMSQTGSTNAGNETASAGAAAVQSLPAGDSGPGGHGQADIRHMLDLLASRGDEVSATLREYQARNSGG